MGAPLLLLVCISIPLLPVLLLLRHRKQLQTPVIQLRLGFIYTSYRFVTLHLHMIVSAALDVQCPASPYLQIHKSDDTAMHSHATTNVSARTVMPPI